MPDTIPLTPVPNGVTFQDRKAIRLFRAGSERLNPTVGTRRYTSQGVADPLGGGIQLRLKFNVIDEFERIDSATVRSYDENDNLVKVSSIKTSFIINTVSLIASADLVVGQHLPSNAAGLRNELTIVMDSRRRIKQLIHVADAPADIVTIDGTVTTATEPLDFLMENIDAMGNFTRTFRCAFFSSWNDEIGRQHGTGLNNLQGATLKPYGGAKTVEVFYEFAGDPFGTVAVAEQECQKTTTMTYAPTSDGELLHISFKFRSAFGTSEYVLGEAWVRFFECEAGTPPTTTCTDDRGDSPIILYPDVPVIDTDPPIFNPPPGVGENEHVLEVYIEHLGQEPSQASTHDDARLFVEAWGGGIDSNQRLLANVRVGTQIEPITTADVGTVVSITLDTSIRDAELYIISVYAGASGSDLQVGNSIVYKRLITDLGVIPLPPTIATSPAPAFNFSTREFTFTLNDFGFAGAALTVSAKPLYGVIRNLSGQAQTYDDIGIDGGGFDNEIIPYSEGTGAKSLTFNFSPSNDLEGIVVYFSNTVGVSTTVVILDEGFTDGGLVKVGPEISGLSLTTDVLTNDTMRFGLDDDGGETGNLTPFYIIVDVNQAQVQVVAAASITSGSGTRQFTMNSGHSDIDGHYYLGLQNPQGGGLSGELIHVSNVGGANTLGA